VAEQDIYKDLVLRMRDIFSPERLAEGSPDRNTIFSMVGDIVDFHGDPNLVTDLELEGVRDVMDGLMDEYMFPRPLKNFAASKKAD
jgi:hypothetical protein